MSKARDSIEDLKTIDANLAAKAPLATPSFTGNATITSGNLVIGTNGKGIDFSSNADSSATGASTTSELLDDYEEGTWTPALKFDGNNVSMVFSSRQGYYTKIGNLVTANCYFALSDKGSSNGAASIFGLPFTNSNVSLNYSAMSIVFNGMSFADMVVGYITPNETQVRLREVTNAGAHTALVQSNFSNSMDMMMTISYRA